MNAKKSEAKLDDFKLVEPETKVVSDKPIIIDVSEPTYQDIDENEFDCIIKY